MPSFRIVAARRFRRFGFRSRVGGRRAGFVVVPSLFRLLGRFRFPWRARRLRVLFDGWPGRRFVSVLRRFLCAGEFLDEEPGGLAALAVGPLH